MDVTSSTSATATSLTAVAVEVVEVRCETDAFVTRVKRQAGLDASGGHHPVTEHPCRKCQAMLLRTPAYHRMEKQDVLVLHYVDPVDARVVETRAILLPRAGSKELNRGGRLVPRDTFQQALKLAGY